MWLDVGTVTPEVRGFSSMIQYRLVTSLYASIGAWLHVCGSTSIQTLQCTGEVFFTKNGRVVKSIDKVPRGAGVADLVPTISLEGQGTAVRVNPAGNFEYIPPSSALAPLASLLTSAKRAPVERAQVKKSKEEELGPYLRCCPKAKRHVRLLRDKVGGAHAR